MTEIILIRHAIAFDRDRRRWPNDDLRPLTPAGKRRFRKAAAGLALWLPSIDCVLCSPLVRAQQTAKLLTRVAGWPEPHECASLTPDANPAQTLVQLRKQSARRIAVVGHEPHLSTLLSVCIGKGRTRLPIEMKKGGVACVRFSGRVDAGRATLIWIVPPRVLRALR